MFRKDTSSIDLGLWDQDIRGRKNRSSRIRSIFAASVAALGLQGCGGGWFDDANSTDGVRSEPFSVNVSKRTVDATGAKKSMTDVSGKLIAVLCEMEGSNGKRYQSESCLWDEAAPGEWIIRAVAKDINVANPTTPMVTVVNQAPSTPSNVKWIQQGDDVVFNWSPATDDTGIKIYQVLDAKGNVVIDNIPGSQTTVTLKSATSGSYVLRAIDNDGLPGVNSSTSEVLINTVPVDTGLINVGVLTAGSLSVGQKVGDFTCKDLESSTCTYTVDNPNFRVSTDGKSLEVVNNSLKNGIEVVNITATDAGGRSVIKQAQITISPAVDAPTKDTAPTVSEITQTSVKVTNNFSDADGVTNKTLQLQSPTGTNIGGLVNLTSNTHVFTGLIANTNYIVVENALANQIQPDGSTKVIAIQKQTPFTTLANPNHAPVANDDLSSTPHNTPKSKNVTANDTDLDGDSLTISGTPTATGGTVTVGPDNKTLTFTPNAGFSGTATVNYTISDGKGGTANGVWTITVQPEVDVTPPTAPVFVSLSGDNVADHPVDITVGYNEPVSVVEVKWIDIDGISPDYIDTTASIIVTNGNQITVRTKNPTIGNYNIYFKSTDARGNTQPNFMFVTVYGQ